MNCFNIREVESLLKRRFFTDLINSKDHHTLLNKTALGLRYKLSDFSSLSNNMDLTYNYGLELNRHSRTDQFSTFFFKKNLNHLNDVQVFSPNAYIFKIVNYFNGTNVFFLLNAFSLFFLEKSFFFVNAMAPLNGAFFFTSVIGNFYSIINNFFFLIANSVYNFFFSIVHFFAYLTFYFISLI